MKSILPFSATFLFLAVTCFGQIGAKTQQGKLHGVWQNNSFGYQMTLQLKPDGTGEFDGEEITFATQGTTLSITQGEVKNAYQFSLQGNSLTLSGGDLESPVTFLRSGSAATTEQPAATTQAPAQPAKAAGGSAGNLTGTWSGYGETIEFKSGGQCVYRGQAFPYSVSGNYITLQAGQENIMMAYAISGNQLHLTVNGQSLTYAKGGSTGTAATTPARPAGGRNLDMSIVGKWCFIKVSSTYSGGSSSSECITLKEDGTYEYYSESSRSVNTSSVTGGTASQDSDRGTWWVEGDRIFYNSQTQGQGSYQLSKRNYPKTGDPMIVLDDRTFVTFYNKAPW